MFFFSFSSILQVSTVRGVGHFHIIPGRKGSLDESRGPEHYSAIIVIKMCVMCVGWSWLGLHKPNQNTNTHTRTQGWSKVVKRKSLNFMALNPR